jgi:hypothetical protein
MIPVPDAMLTKPCAMGESVLTVREILHEADDSRAKTGLPHTWQNQPSAEDWWKLLHRIRQERTYKPDHE